MLPPHFSGQRQFLCQRKPWRDPERTTSTDIFKLMYGMWIYKDTEQASELNLVDESHYNIGFAVVSAWSQVLLSNWTINLNMTSTNNMNGGCRDPSRAALAGSKWNKRLQPHASNNASSRRNHNLGSLSAQMSRSAPWLRPEWKFSRQYQQLVWAVRKWTGSSILARPLAMTVTTSRAKLNRSKLSSSVVVLSWGDILFEIDYLRLEYIIRLCDIGTDNGAAFVKASTVMNSLSMVVDLKLTRPHSGPNVQIEASRGVRILNSIELRWRMKFIHNPHSANRKDLPQPCFSFGDWHLARQSGRFQ